MTDRNHEALDASIKAIEAIRAEAWDKHDEMTDSLADDRGHIDSVKYNDAIDEINDLYNAATVLDLAYDHAIDHANQIKGQ